MTAAEWNLIIGGGICRVTPQGTLEHPGLPAIWGIAICIAVTIVAVWGLYTPASSNSITFNRKSGSTVSAIPLFGSALGHLWISPWVLLSLKTVTAGLFLTVIWAGLAGTPIPGRNLATVLTWNLWWSGIIISVLFVGSAWCAVCPWDTLANLMVRLRVWRRSLPHFSLNFRVPKKFRNVWPALVLLVGLTWLELGVGITTSPYATAMLALGILLLAIIFLGVFERKALCRFACPVGRTIGFYAQLAPVELRAKDMEICTSCKTLECYHGNANVDPCPTHLVMGRLKQNTFCTSCGNCVRSCPHENVSWRLRSPGKEALEGARPHWDEAWFMLVLLTLTGFHGITMLEFWENRIRQLARYLGDSGQLIWSFSIAMGVAIAIPVALFVCVVALTRWSTGSNFSFRMIFTRLSFTALPLAFTYHLAHNLSHLLRESIGSGSVFMNPLGVDALPLSVNERHLQMLEMTITPFALAAIQAVLLVLGFIFSVLVVRRRGKQLVPEGSRTLVTLSPMFGFAILMTAFHLWLLMQPMNMRM